MNILVLTGPSVESIYILNFLLFSDCTYFLFDFFILSLFGLGLTCFETDIGSVPVVCIQRWLMLQKCKSRGGQASGVPMSMHAACPKHR